MGKINVLPFAVANLIAAGEVVDRPASVVKELMENAIDAGASRITVEIQNGGVSFMRVTDNGCGMSPEDLPIAVKRHATSKIKNAEDLDGIITLGFRGEALAAISSVSHLRILTKTREAQAGAMLESVGGENVHIHECGCADGTTVIVEELFANVPARRKFLKKDMTEAMAVTANVERVALSHPEIGFRLIVDGSVKMETMGDGDLRHAIHSVFGKDFSSRLIEVSGQDDTGSIRISGYIGRSDNVKANRNYQNYFINGRYVKSKTACAALEQAYCSYIPPEKFPCCVLNISVLPGAVDVNVHPAKLEVKFSNERPVFEAVYYSVRNALLQNTTRPQLNVDKMRVGDHLTAKEARELFAKEEKAAGRKPPLTSAFTPITDKLAQKLDTLQIHMEMPEGTRTEDAKSVGKPVQGQAERTTERGQTGGITPAPEVAYTCAKTPTTEDRNVRTLGNGNMAQPAEGQTCVPCVPGSSGQENHAAALEGDEPRVAVPVLSATERPLRGEVARPSILNEMARQMPDKTHGQPATVPNDTGGSGGVLRTAFKASLSAEETDFSMDMPFPGSTPTAEANNAGKSAEPVGDMPDEVPHPKEQSEKVPYRIIGEVFQFYVLVERGDSLLLIDKHAAHERILFEQLKESLAAREQLSQMLMLPVIFELPVEDAQTVEDFRAEIEAIGFSFEKKGQEFSVYGIPCGISPDAVPDMFMTFADNGKYETGSARLTRDILFEKALYQAACKAAIKAGRNYADGHIEWICEKLMQLPDITFCPHGRPVALELKKSNLDRQFGRT